MPPKRGEPGKDESPDAAQGAELRMLLDQAVAAQTATQQAQGGTLFQSPSSQTNVFPQPVTFDGDRYGSLEQIIDYILSQEDVRQYPLFVHLIDMLHNVGAFGINLLEAALQHLPQIQATPGLEEVRQQFSESHELVEKTKPAR